MTSPTIEVTDTIAMDAYTGDAPVVGHFASDYEAWALARPIRKAEDAPS